jgi:hypothetical protein
MLETAIDIAQRSGRHVGDNACRTGRFVELHDGTAGGSVNHHATAGILQQCAATTG